MSMVGEVLNPYLFRRLQSVFHRVKVSHPGESMVARIVDGLDGLRYHIRHWGEMYHIACPFCDDQYSLAVSHRYGQIDGLGRRMTYAAFCRRRECHSRPGNRARLYEMISGYGGALEEARIRPGREVSDERKAAALPEPMTRLDRLPDDHPARRYLVRRGLDPDRVGRVYKVGYCGQVGESLARNKIIIPVAECGDYKGWQALAIAPDDIRSAADAAPVKLYTAPGMRASAAVYNIDRARAYQTGIIVPTPIDVWRFGSMAVSPLGEVWSERQCRTIAAEFPDRCVVLLADAARLERPSTRRVIQFLSRRMSGRFAVVELADPRRRKAYDRGFLRDLVVEEAASQRVRVRFTKAV